MSINLEWLADLANGDEHTREMRSWRRAVAEGGRRGVSGELDAQWLISTARPVVVPMRALYDITPQGVLVEAAPVLYPAGTL